jgi:hypothetical protein
MTVAASATLAGVVGGLVFGVLAAVVMPALGTPGLAMPLAVGGACGTAAAAMLPRRRRPHTSVG